MGFSFGERCALNPEWDDPADLLGEERPGVNRVILTGQNVRPHRDPGAGYVGPGFGAEPFQAVSDLSGGGFGEATTESALAGSAGFGVDDALDGDHAAARCGSSASTRAMPVGLIMKPLA